MPSLIDRYILRSLLSHYLIALGVMISLYVALDMFINMDEFTESDASFVSVLVAIFRYYWPNVFLFFAQLSGIITLFACLAVIARLRRMNELTAVLSSGVSLYRIARPIVAFGIATTTLAVIDTEMVIPSIAHLLARRHDDAAGHRTYEVLFLKDRDNAVLSAGAYNPSSRDLRRLLVMKQDDSGAVVETIEADRGVWEPPDQGRLVGRWRLDRGRRLVRIKDMGETLGPRNEIEERLIQYYESDLGPEQIQLRQSEGWIQNLSLRQLRELERAGSGSRLELIHARNTKIAAPLMSMVLLLLGLPFFLDRSPANVLSDAGRCMVVCGLCYVSSVVAQNLRPDSGSALVTWAPIFIFGTLAVVLIDRIRT